MKALLCLAVMLSGCVAPSMTIYRPGYATDKNGNQRSAAVKALQFYGDYDAAHSIDVTPSRVSIVSQGPYTNSRLADVNYKGAAAIARATIQPIIFGAMTGGILGGIPGAVKP